ncbi:uncharacterized protein LOC110119075 [Ceratitis capitata]|uniref:uncharacterized protein LOC110119075 n=1 Tax=Ceratitis capitata TaxID=7213 RepID=UPI000A11B4E0|nr:uncharacterized protein LOC110119075 [Ceratitis capitata]
MYMYIHTHFMNFTLCVLALRHVKFKRKLFWYRFVIFKWTSHQKKIWADLKSRTKRKRTKRRLSGTGDGPIHFSALTEMEKSIDPILLMSTAAAPSGLVLGMQYNQQGQHYHPQRHRQY